MQLIKNWIIEKDKNQKNIVTKPKKKMLFGKRRRLSLRIYEVHISFGLDP